MLFKSQLNRERAAAAKAAQQGYPRKRAISPKFIEQNRKKDHIVQQDDPVAIDLKIKALSTVFDELDRRNLADSIKTQMIHTIQHMYLTLHDEKIKDLIKTRIFPINLENKQLLLGRRLRLQQKYDENKPKFELFKDKKPVGWSELVENRMVRIIMSEQKGVEEGFSGVQKEESEKISLKGQKQAENLTFGSEIERMGCVSVQKAPKKA